MYVLMNLRNRIFYFVYRQQRKRQHTIRYHILRRKYVAHPNDIKVDPYVKNHMQFLHKNYPSMILNDFYLEFEILVFFFRTLDIRNAC